LPQQIEEKEALIQSKMQAVPGVRGVSGCGLMWAVSLDSFEQVLAVMYDCQRRGLLIDWFLYKGNALRIAPPLIISLEELEKALEIVTEAIAEVRNHSLS